MDNFLSLLLIVLIVIVLLSPTTTTPAAAALSEDNGGVLRSNITRGHFPDGFIFGAATSAYQIEGGYLEDSKSLNNWDVFTKKGKVLRGENGDVAADHYHRYMEDIDILHSLGVDAYRFSISWSRILPSGRFGEVNPAGIQFYDKIIDNLLARGIEPFVTLHHGDFPQELEDRYGSWLSPSMQEDFVYFAEICFKNFGDRVKYWMTINEPNLMSQLSYQSGVFPPNRCSPPFGNCSAGNSITEPLVALHNMLLAHAKAVKLYRHKFQKKQGGVIGIVGHMWVYRPLTESELDKKAASKAMAFFVTWMIDPLVFGEYPSEMVEYYKTKMPRFTCEEKELIKDSIDFIGVNHYTTLYAKDCSQSDCECNAPDCAQDGGRLGPDHVYITGEKDGVLIGEKTGSNGSYVVPEGMEEIVEYLKNRYYNKPMFITENGYSPPQTINGEPDDLHDYKRIEYHKSYLSYLARAIRNGADVRGYFVWTLVDDFEWSNGFGPKFGIHYINYPTLLDRIPRSSATWYRDFLNHGISLQRKNVNRFPS